MTALATPKARSPRNVGPFSAVLVLWLSLIGALAFIASLVIGAFGAEWKSGDNGAGHALSRSAIGFAGVVEVLRAMGTEVEISRVDYPADDGRSVLIVTPPAGTDPDAINDIYFEGPRLLVLPKWMPGPYRQGWVRGRNVLSPKASLWPANGDPDKKDDADHKTGGKAEEVQDEEAEAEDEARPNFPSTLMATAQGTAKRTLVLANGQPFATTGPIEGFRTVGGGGWTAVVREAKGGIVLGRRGDEWILSDPDLLNTHGLSDLATAKAGIGLLQLVRDGDGPVVFDVSLNGLKSERNLLQLAFTAPFLGVTLALGLTTLLLCMQAVSRFGPPIGRGRVFALGKQSLADNSAALIRLARREHRMVERYALYVRGEAARAVGIPHSIAEADLEALLDRMSGQLGLPLFSELRRQGAAAHDLASALAAARRLYFWRLEMTRERR
ncbi:MAG: hypothetical protein KF842_01825 [Caulobacter sp.]|nr:hypothetical protein [Caulobacter sp.]